MGHEQKVDTAAHGTAKRLLVGWWGQFGLIDADTGGNMLPRGRRAQAILAVVLARPGVPVLRSDLATLFWGDRGDEQARASVRQSLAELRHLAANGEAVLTIDQRSITAISDRIVGRDTQLNEFRAAGDAAGLLALLDKGDGFLAGLDGLSAPFDEWLRGERVHSLESLVAAATEIVAKSSEQGRAVDAQRLINRLQAIEPLEERLARAGFAADAAASDAASLERRMRALEKKLREELDVSPSPATVEAHQSALDALKEAPATRSAAAPLRPRFGKPKLVLAAIGGLVLIVAAIAIIWRANQDQSPFEPRTIAVVPFAAAADQSDLANGFAEEILSRLSRNPKIAPLGRNSARLIGDDAPSAIALGRELRVSHLLTGTLTNRGERLSVETRLIRTSDGEPVWSQTYEGTTAELVSLFNRIGSDVSARLGAGSLPQPKSGPQKPEAAQLYYRAKRLIRGGEPQNVSTAVELYRQSARLDPDFAPAWSELAMAVRTQHLQSLTPEGDPNSVLIPQAYARRGLELAPDSALSNLAMADSLAEDPRSLPYALRAVQLDRSNPMIWYELAEKFEKAGDYRRMKYAQDQAAKIDPLWPAVVLPAAYMNWNLGNRQLAASQVQQLYRHGQPRPHIQHMLRGDLAFRLGDFSKAMEEFTAASRSTDAAGRVWADSGRGSVYFNVGMFNEARPLIAFKAIESDWDIFEGNQPTPAAVEISRKHPFYAWNMQERNYFLLRLLVNGGRFPEVAALYDRRFKSPEEFARTPRGHESFLNDSIPVILALRQVGRAREADRIQAIARAEIQKRYDAGVIPSWYEVIAAQHFALDGDQARALTSLERAYRLGWLNRLYLGLPNIEDEPAFRSLVGNPRFEALRQRMQATYTRERGEVLAVLARTG